MAGVVISKTAKTKRIPDDVIEDILSKLPVKSLRRFRCICKIWCSVISDPHFCANLRGRRNAVLICENSNKFSTTTIESCKTKAPTPLSLPWDTEADDQNQVLGSCHGFVCVDLKNESRSGLILWNPSTGQFRKLPRPSGYQVQDKYFTYAWFGYDELIHDYKLVWLNCGRQCRIEHGLVDVFTMKSNTWRRIPIYDTQVLRMHYEKLFDRDDPKSIGFFFNGAVHWCISYCPPRESGKKKEVVALFDYMHARIWDCDRDEKVRLRIQGGGENVRFEETRIRLNQSNSKVVLHMEESFVSLPQINQSNRKVVLHTEEIVTLSQINQNNRKVVLHTEEIVTLSQIKVGYFPVAVHLLDDEASLDDQDDGIFHRLFVRLKLTVPVIFDCFS